MAENDSNDEYILLPIRGLRAKSSSAIRVFSDMPIIDAEETRPYEIEDFAAGLPLTIIDSAEPMGPMLVKASRDVEEMINQSDLDARLVRKVKYNLPKTGQSSNFRNNLRLIQRPSGQYFNTTFKCV